MLPTTIKMMKGFLEVMFFLGLGFSGLAQTPTSPSVNYDFDFTRLERGASSWKLSGSNYVFSIEQVETQKEIRALQISGCLPALINTAATSFECKIAQLIPLQKNVIKGSFSLDAKMQNIELAWVKVYGLDNSERIIRKDSIHLINSETWKNGHVNFSLKGIASLYVEITAYTSKERFKQNRTHTNFSLSKLSLLIDGKDIRSFPLSVSKNMDLQIADVKENIPLVDNNEQCFSRISDLKSHRIIALGETVPGSITSQANTYNLMKQMIRDENCRLILLDYPLSSTLQWNQYIHGAEKTKFKEFLSPLVYGSNSPRLFESFLEWVRQYNEHCDHKVTIVGFDVSRTIYYNYLADYLISLNISSSYFDSLLFKICKHQFREALELASESDSLNRYLDPLELNLFLVALKNVSSDHLTEGKPEKDKSFLRFNNIKEIITAGLKKNEKAILMSDFSIINRLNADPTSVSSHAVGYWLNKEYGNDFFVITLLLGNGLFTHANTVEISSVNVLEQPLPGSLEDLCLKGGQSFFYKNVSSNSYDRLGFMRWMDKSVMMSQFERCNYNRRMDAFLFIRDSKGFDIPADWPKNDKEFFDFNAGLMQKDFERHFSKKFFRPTHKYRISVKR